jgi:hypothetical protein
MKRQSEEVRVMTSLRNLSVEKREVVLNLANAEFRGQPAKKPAAKKKTSAPVNPAAAAA